MLHFMNAKATEDLLENCDVLLNEGIAASVNLRTFESMSSSDFQLMTKMIALYNETKKLTLNYAKQLDEQSEMLDNLQNQMKERASENAKILAQLDKLAKKD